MFVPYSLRVSYTHRDQHLYEVSYNNYTLALMMCIPLLHYM